MKTRFSVLVLAALLVGCGGEEETTKPADDTTKPAAGEGGDTESSQNVLAPVDTDVALATPGETDEAIVVKFAAGESATLAVPEMSCPFACYPKVKETLEGIDGVEAVELVEQEDPNAINDRRVVVKFAGEVDSQSVIAALDKAEFANSKFEATANN